MTNFLKRVWLIPMVGLVVVASVVLVPWQWWRSRGCRRVGHRWVHAEAGTGMRCLRCDLTQPMDSDVWT
jgi:hypothetical protein